MRYSTLLVTMAAAAGMVNAHIGMFHPSALDFYGDGYDVVTPLANRQFKDWWFHGKLDTASKVTETFALPAGSSVTVELSCRKEFTSYGRSRNNDPCPLDTPSIHAATPVDTGRLLGCGLAIAYKSDFHEVRPNDFTIFSVNHDCVRTTSTEFQVPKDMPECPSGGCICAWFWQGQNSADEMYMTGFRCGVEGGSKTSRIATPKSPVLCDSGSGSSCVQGAKYPMYWANSDSNIDFDGQYEHKPAYNMRWGFQDGAQNDIFIYDNSGKDQEDVKSRPEEPEEIIDEKPEVPVEEPVAPKPTEAPVDRPTSTTTVIILKPTTTFMTVTRTRTVVGGGQGVPKPTPVDKECAWIGHCAGDPCNNWDDCDHQMVCIKGKCGVKYKGLSKYT